jgi:hypothetical protein
VTRGFLTGEHPLLQVKRSDSLCLGLIGTKQCFCLKPVAGGVGNANMFCCDAHWGARFPVDWTAYYVPMKDSALVAPFIMSEELERFSSTHLLREKHSSKDWIVILDELHAIHCSLVNSWVWICPSGAPRSRERRSTLILKRRRQ